MKDANSVSHSLEMDEVMQEMVEVKGLADELRKRRQLQLSHLQEITQKQASEAETEVFTCKYHLAARAKPISLT